MAAVLPIAALAAGCTLLETGTPITQQSLLQAARPSEDAVTLDLYWVRLPDDGALDDELWNGVREDALPLDLRRRLLENGLRAGIASAATPDVLLRLIDPEGQADTSAAGVTELRDTGVRRRTRQMRPGRDVELNASEVLDEAPLLVVHDGRLTGKTYQQAQGVYVLDAEHADDEHVVVRLLPEVHHGEQLLRFVSDETGAITRGSLRRDAVSFAELTIEAPLAAGEMLLVTNVTGAGSRLGGLMHESGDHRKAILIRVAATPPTRAFSPEG